jgi:hypothetical protein
MPQDYTFSTAPPSRPSIPPNASLLVHVTHLPVCGTSTPQPNPSSACTLPTALASQPLPNSLHLHTQPCSCQHSLPSKKPSHKAFSNFPSLTATSLRRHPPSSIPMTKGHLDQTRQNQRSMKPPTPIITPDDDDTCLPPDNEFMPTGIPSKTHHCFATIIEPTGQIYTDQTGRFVSTSSNGNNYLMILRVYDYDSNFIFSQPFKNRTAACIINAYKALHARLCTAGLALQLQRLDNECSTSLKTFMTEQNIGYQLVPPRVHRQNAAERAIRTFQNHFIAGLCSVNKEFPIHLWDRLIPQAEITLNLLHGSRLSPIPSYWHGPKSMAHSILIVLHSDHPAAVSLPMPSPPPKPHGPHMD